MTKHECFIYLLSWNLLALSDFSEDNLMVFCWVKGFLLHHCCCQRSPLHLPQNLNHLINHWSPVIAKQRKIGLNSKPHTHGHVHVHVAVTSKCVCGLQSRDYIYIKFDQLLLKN